MKHTLILLTFAVTLVSCLQPQSETGNGTTSKSMNEIFASYYEERLQLFPLEATAIADNRYDDRLPCDISDAYHEKLKLFYKKYLDKISGLKREELKGEDALSYDVFKREMEMQLVGLNFKDNLIPFNQFWGMHLTFGQLGSGEGIQPFKTVKDYDNFLGRVHGFSIWCDTAVANMRRGMEQKIVLPKILVERILPQLNAMLVTDVTESVFYGPIKKLPDSFSADDKQRLTDAYKKAIEEEVIPSYKRLNDFMKDEYLAAGRSTAGISDIPEGKEMYAYLAKFWTTTNMTPDEIFETGQKEVARLRAEMERVMKETGYNGDLKSFFKYLHTDKKFNPYKQPAEVINAFRNIETRMQPKLKELFNMVPKAKFEVRQTEKFREASASAEYNQAAPDGSRPGIFYVPVPDAAKFNNVGMESLFLHEAIPGHHYQISIQQENEQLPKFRRFGWYGAYGEGWALYSESLGKELGLYTDPYQYFGSLNEEMHRAIRLVVDVGMHMKGWTREQAIQFSMENDAETEADIIAEIERYMAIPGQALAYKIGQLKIIEIRKRAEKELGEKFSIRKFHDEVLISGCLPMEVFESKMNAWIKSQQGARS
jgi:uncharacterized protein (DUF885 family)